MQLHKACLVIFLTTALVSGCAYMEGRKDQQQTVNQTGAHTKNAVVIPGQTNTNNPPSHTSSNPSNTASKMIAPLTQ